MALRNRELHARNDDDDDDDDVTYQTNVYSRDVCLTTVRFANLITDIKKSYSA